MTNNSIAVTLISTPNYRHHLQTEKSSTSLLHQTAGINYITDYEEAQPSHLPATQYEQQPINPQARKKTRNPLHRNQQSMTQLHPQLGSYYLLYLSLLYYNKTLTPQITPPFLHNKPVFQKHPLKPTVNAELSKPNLKNKTTKQTKPNNQKPLQITKITKPSKN